MALLVDANEARNHPTLIDWLRQSVDVNVASINQTAGSTVIYPDFVVFGGNKLVGINRKTWGEVLSSIDKVEEQLQRELAGPVEQLALLIEGQATPDGQQGAWAYNLGWGELKLWRGDSVGSIPFRRQHYQANYKGIMNWLTRLEWMGIQVIYSAGLYDSACRMVAMHDLVMKNEDSKTLNRLIKAQFSVLSLDPQEKAMALSLMGLQQAGVGEELGLTIASAFGSITELIRYWDDGGVICDLMLRNGTRRVGNAAEAKLQRALGYTRPDNEELLRSPEVHASIS